MSLREYLDFATETAYLAGRLTLGYFRTGFEAEMKEDDSPVTIADRQAEELIRRRVAAAYPDHGCLGEEGGAHGPDEASHRWIVDPIDGTKSFVRGVPLYAVLIGLEIEGRPEVGAVYFPALDEMVSAATGLGCWWNGRPAHVSTVSDPGRAYVSCSDFGSFEPHGRQAAWERIAARTYHRVAWGDAYGHCLVATGRIEIMLDPVMHPWDCAPFPPILAEAGGFFGDWQGRTTIYGNEAISTTQALLPYVLDMIRG
ncbi:MAG: inositol monophosphatase family protein [Acidobacteria bacterium]|nr:MAG: inositol monophosphatase family protein [Acidobacteriota bacterium]